MESFGELLPRTIAQLEVYRNRYPTAAEDIEQLQHMLAAWRAYKEGKQKECVEEFAAAVAHDSPTVDPQRDPPFLRYLGQAVLALEKDSRANAVAVAEAMAFFCLAAPRAIKLNDVSAGRKLDQLADKHPGNWYIQYTKATWRVMREDRQRSADALTKAIAAGGPCGMYYTRARVYSNMQKKQLAAADYAKFLELAPSDNRSIPDAHYALALDAVMDLQNPDLAAARRHFEWGQAAESKVAPWVGYQGGEAKMMAQLLMAAPAFQGR